MTYFFRFVSYYVIDEFFGGIMGAIGGVVDFRNCNINFASFNAIRSAQTLRGHQERGEGK